MTVPIDVIVIRYVLYVIKPYDIIKIDTEQNIFQSMYYVNFTEFYYLNGRLYNSILNKKPCFAHFNGFNVYDYLITSLKTSLHENVYDVFLSTMKKSKLCSDIPLTLDYKVRFYISTYFSPMPIQ
jgi:hypothetical protein